MLLTENEKSLCRFCALRAGKRNGKHYFLSTISGIENRKLTTKMMQVAVADETTLNELRLINFCAQRFIAFEN
jgi:hypothetical protein